MRAFALAARCARFSTFGGTMNKKVLASHTSRLASKKRTQQPDIESLKAIAHGVVQAIGEAQCEVIIHDLADLEHSIIWIEGNVTERCIGGAMTDLGIAKIKAGEFDDLLNYTSETDDGRLLKSCSIFLRDAEGIPRNAFCLNLDLTPFIGLVNQLNSTLLRFTDTNVVETFSDDVEVTIRNWVTEAAYELGKPVTALTRAERLRLIQILDRKGLFQIKRATPLLAKYLHVSRYTIYLYLNELRAENKPHAVSEL
jgi:predicted transcriptional regulator YheO